MLPKHFCSFVLHHTEELQKQLEEALDSRPWVFGFADVCVKYCVIFTFLMCSHFTDYVEVYLCCCNYGFLKISKRTFSGISAGCGFGDWL